MRTSLVPIVASVLLLAACGATDDKSGASEKSDVSLGLVQGQDFTHAVPAQMAAAKGIFTRHGLNVRIVEFSAGSDLVKAVAGGTVDVAEATGLDVVAAAAAGVDLKAFYGTAAATPMSVIVKADSPVEALPDLAGKKVGISKFGSLTDFTAKLITQQAPGLKPVPLGAPSANTAALTKGDVDAIILPVEFAYTMAAAGTPARAIRVADLTPDSQFAVLAAPAKFLSSKKDTATKLSQAYADAIKQLQSDKDGTVALEVSKLGMTPDVAAKTYDELAKDFTPNGKISTAGLKAYADQLPTLGIAKKVPGESSYYDGTFA
jgi:NitT/TauT family transport system substrate-binding protein